MNAYGGRGGGEAGKRRMPHVGAKRFRNQEAAKPAAVGPKGKGGGGGGDWKWKRRKAEQMKCDICGETGHFTQGCPTTLGVNKKAGEGVEKIVEIVEKIPIKDKHLRPKLLNTSGSGLQAIEKDTGCRIRLEDDPSAGAGAFSVCVSGPDQNAVSSAVTSVKDMVDKLQDELKVQNVRRPQEHYGNSTRKPLVVAQMQHNPAPKPHPNRNFHRGRVSHPGNRQNPHLEARRPWGPAPSGRAAPGPGKFMHSAMPHKDHAGYHDWSEDRQSYPSHGRGFPVLQPRPDPYIMQEPRPFAPPIEEMEKMFSEEATEISKQQAVEEDRENGRHHEQMRLIQDYYQQKSIQLRSKYEEQMKGFLQHEPQSQQHYQLQTTHNHFVSSGGGPPFPHNRHGNSSGEQYDMNPVMNVQGQEAGYDPYQNSAQYYINSVPANHRNQVFETMSRGSQHYDNDPHIRSSPFPKHAADQ